MNSEYITALRVHQHQADLLRLAGDHRLARPGRPRRPGRAAPRWARWWGRRGKPACQPEVAGA